MTRKEKIQAINGKFGKNQSVRLMSKVACRMTVYKALSGKVVYLTPKQQQVIDELYSLAK